MKITSPVFLNNQPIPSKYTCDGTNVNPPLVFENIPVETKSLVLIVDDPDASAGTWTHWLVWNVAPSTRMIKENSLPENAVEGTTSFGKPGYGGPCQNWGTHRYFFKLFALDTELNLTKNTGKEQLERIISKHVISKAEIIGLYSVK